MPDILLNDIIVKESALTSPGPTGFHVPIPDTAARALAAQPPEPTETSLPLSPWIRTHGPWREE